MNLILILVLILFNCYNLYANSICINSNCNCIKYLNSDGILNILCRSLNMMPNITNLPIQLTNVLNLDLRDNSFLKIPSYSFNQMRINKLDFQNNGVEHISKDAFKGVKFLRRLNLAQNPLNRTLMHESIFEPLYSLLEELDMTNVKLRRMLNLSNFQYLKYVHFSGNKIQSIKTDMFPKSVREIMLDINELIVIKNGWFRNLKNLELINFRCNKIQFIEKDSFVNLVSLKKLDLSLNNLTKISNIWFKFDKLNYDSIPNSYAPTIILHRQKNNLTIDNYAFDIGTYMNYYIGVNGVEIQSEKPFCSRTNKSIRLLNLQKVFVSYSILYNTNPCLFFQFVNETRYHSQDNLTIKYSIGSIFCNCKTVNYLLSLGIKNVVVYCGDYIFNNTSCFSKNQNFTSEMYAYNCEMYECNYRKKMNSNMKATNFISSTERPVSSLSILSTFSTYKRRVCPNELNNYELKN